MKTRAEMPSDPPSSARRIVPDFFGIIAGFREKTFSLKARGHGERSAVLSGSFLRYESWRRKTGFPPRGTLFNVRSTDYPGKKRIPVVFEIDFSLFQKYVFFK